MEVILPIYDINDCASSPPRTLCDWVKNFRIKRLQMKRKLRSGGNLRVCAIMSTALFNAENQLRLKQQERLNRCLQMQSQFHEKLKMTTATSSSLTSSSSIYSPSLRPPPPMQPPLPPLPPPLSSSSSSPSALPVTRTMDINGGGHWSESSNFNRNEKDDHRRRIEICNLWRDELNGLDEFMRKMSSSNSSNSCSSRLSINSSSVQMNRTCCESAYKNECTSIRQQHSIAVSN